MSRADGPTLELQKASWVLIQLETWKADWLD